MKTHPLRLLAASVLIAGIANAQHIDPTTGQPVTANAASAHVDPLTGLMVSDKDGNPFNPADRESFSGYVAMTDRAGWPEAETDELIINGKYDEALQTLRTYVHRERKGKGWLDPLFIRWFSLCDKFPPARAALTETRDQDVQQFSRGGGSPDLFLEVRSIEQFLQRTDPTVHVDDAISLLFKVIQGQNQKLAEQCYPEAEWSLAQMGEYQLCLNYIGDPQARFGSFSNQFVKRIALVPRSREEQIESRRHLEEMLAKAKQIEQESQRNAQQFQQELEKKMPVPPGSVARPPVPVPPPGMVPRFTPPPFKPFDLGQAATNDFTAQVHILVEILVGAGRNTDAEKIRDQAVTVMDDEHLRSAVTDAEAKIKK